MALIIKFPVRPKLAKSEPAVFTGNAIPAPEPAPEAPPAKPAGRKRGKSVREDQRNNMLAKVHIGQKI